MVHLFLLRPSPNHFASDELRRHATLRRARIGLTKASAAILAVGLAVGGWHVLRAVQGSEVDQRAEQQLAQINAEHDSIVRSTPTLGVGGSTMRDTVAFYNGSIRPFPSLPVFVGALSKVLGAHPDVRVTQLSWLATDDAKALPPLNTIASRLAPSVKTVARAGVPPPAAQPADAASNPPFAGGRYEVALLEATLRVASDDFRGAIGAAQKLADDISNLPGVDAEVLESPLDVRSSLALQGRHDGGQTPTMETRFVLRIVRERAGGA